MKPKILTWGQIPFSEATPDAVLRQQARLTLQQVVEWGKEPCSHPGMVDHSPFGLLVILRRECPECWAELEEMCDE